MEPKVTITEHTFWSMYNAIKDAESVLWQCNGSTNPEDEELTESIVETSEHLQTILHNLQPVVRKIKDNKDLQ